MTKEELFEKYHINESHNVWDNQIDNWFSVEIYRIMHEGDLPPPDDMSIDWVTGFLDKTETDVAWFFNLENKSSFYMTAKRMVYRFCDEILKLQDNEISTGDS